MNTVITALKTVLAQGLYRWLTVIAFAGFVILYLFTLPSSFTGGQIGVVALQFLDAKMVVLSVTMALLAALTVALIVFLFKRGLRASKSSAVGGVAVGLLTPLLCCSPLLPMAFGALAGVLPSLGGTLGPQVQGFIATHQTELFLSAILLLVLALYLNARKVVEGAGCAV